MSDIWEFTGGQWHWQAARKLRVSRKLWHKGCSGRLPGGRYWSSWYTDKTGKFWLFGGNDGMNGSFNDLWTLDIPIRFCPSGRGSAAPAPSIRKGPTTGSSAVPGARLGASAWVDSAGTFWLFGGDGSDSAGNVGELNDLWTFSAIEMDLRRRIDHRWRRRSGIRNAGSSRPHQCSAGTVVGFQLAGPKWRCVAARWTAIRWRSVQRPVEVRHQRQLVLDGTGSR